MSDREIGAAIEWTHDEDQEEEALFGLVDVFGTLHHICAVRVTTDEQGHQVATKDPYGRLDDAYALDPDTIYQTTEIPGRNGEWVLVMSPGGA